MRVRSTITAALALSASPTLADFLGVHYPWPCDLSSNSSLVAAAFQNLSLTLEAAVQPNDTLPINTTGTTFSFGLFSVHGPDAKKLQYHYLAPDPAAVPTLNGDAIYRVASITKLFTVLVGLLNLNETQWNQPLSEIFPVLVEMDAANKPTTHPFTTPDGTKSLPGASQPETPASKDKAPCSLTSSTHTAPRY